MFYYTTNDQVEKYDGVIGVFNELFKELKELSKKKPDATLNASKVKIINRVLVDVKDCLSDQPEDKYLDQLDSDALPQYSDATLVLSQYEGALKAFKDRCYGYDNSLHMNTWRIDDSEENSNETGSDETEV